MKPDWKDAPEWAQWLAMDEDGVWFWFEHMPYLDVDGVWRIYGGNYSPAYSKATYKQSLEGRPS